MHGDVCARARVRAGWNGVGCAWGLSRERSSLSRKAMPSPKAMPSAREARNRYTKAPTMPIMDDSVPEMPLYVCMAKKRYRLLLNQLPENQK